MQPSRRLALLGLLALPAVALAQSVPAEPVLGAGDVIRVSVFQSPDLTAEARISESGQINFPLIGTVTVGGLSVAAAEQRIAKLLRDGGFVLKPQVTIQTVRIRSAQISILGQVGKPGRYPIETVNSKVSEMISTAGGVLPTGADIVTLVGSRDGKPVKLDIDLPAILQSGRADLDVVVENGDIIYVDRAASIYIYGEVQRPGQLRLERGIRVHRKDGSGATRILELKMTETVQRDDVIYVRESLF